MDQLKKTSQVDGKSMLAKAACSADPVQVGLAVGPPVDVHGKVIIHDDCHLNQIVINIKPM